MNDTTTKTFTPDDVIAELRTGKYRKGSGGLCTRKDGDTRYCCLGVMGRMMGLTEGQLAPYGYLLTDWEATPDTKHLVADTAFPWLTTARLTRLARANDTTENWEEQVIPVLEQVQATLDAEDQS